MGSTRSPSDKSRRKQPRQGRAERQEKGIRLEVGDNREGREGQSRFPEDWEEGEDMVADTSDGEEPGKDSWDAGKHKDACRSQTALVFEGGSKSCLLEAVQCPSK